MKKPFYCLLVFFITSLQISYSQDTIYLKDALSIPDAFYYGREAIYTDALAYQLYNNTLRKPEANTKFDYQDNGNKAKWRAVTADRNNVFKNNDRVRNRYLYFTYESKKAETVLLNTTGSSSVFVNGTLHAGDPYNAGWLYIPVALKKGLNNIFVRAYGETTVKIIKVKKPVFLLTADLTLPDIILKQPDSLLQGAIVVMNTTNTPLIDYKITCSIEGKTVKTDVPFVAAYASRKVIFNIDPSAIKRAGKYDCVIKITGTYTAKDEQTITIQAVHQEDRHNNTFVSNIDGSLQYYAVTPQHGGDTAHHALFLSVHGAGVEAKGQAAAYDFKDWGTLVAATNRRPRGFNWEDWGRIDALEVLNIAEQKFTPDSQRIYLTGHSMGGHGTWYLGVNYPDKWAAIGPCSGYPSLKDYGSADGKIPDSNTMTMPTEQMLLRASNQSDVLKMLRNYQPVPVYVLHGDSDHVVPVRFARQMRDSLSKFHTDFVYHEVPGADHWYGNQSVDWPALFDFFKNRTRKPDSIINHIDFITANPGVASSYRWAAVIQQMHPLKYSHITLKRNDRKDSITGFTENVQMLKISLKDFADDKPINIQLDSSLNVRVIKAAEDDSIYLFQYEGNWIATTAPHFNQKNPMRYGTFKEAFNNKMVFVFSTNGTKEENLLTFNKALYDAETWYYRGNGAVDIIPDKLYSPQNYGGRNIIIYGNATTNLAWNYLLADCPLQVTRGSITVGDKTMLGDDIAAYFTWPQQDAYSTVGVVAGTGIKGMDAAIANQYFAGGSGFPDFIVFTLSMLKEGAKGVQLAGYFNTDWKLDDNEMVQSE